MKIKKIKMNKREGLILVLSVFFVFLILGNFNFLNNQDGEFFPDFLLENVSELNETTNQMLLNLFEEPQYEESFREIDLSFSVEVINSSDSVILSDIKKTEDSTGKVHLLVKLDEIDESKIKEENIKKRTKDFIALEIPEEEVEDFVYSGELEPASVFADYSFSILLEDSKLFTQYFEVENNLNLSQGKNKICIVDTGADENLVGTSITGYNVFDGTTNISSTSVHGTWMARTIHLLSPNSELFMAKVFNNQEETYSSDVLLGLEWCESQDPDIISMSIGGGMFEGICIEDPVAKKVSNLTQSGILVVASAGNYGFPVLASPACGEYVLSVGASKENNSISRISNFNNALDLLAPGEGVVISNSLGEEMVLSGTSVSTAIVSGGLGFVLGNNSFSPLEVEDDLRNSGKLISKIPFIQFDNFVEGVKLNDFPPANLSLVNGTAEQFYAQAACTSLSGKKFEVRNSTGSPCLQVNESGFGAFFGEVTESCSTAPGASSFQITDDGGQVLMWIDDATCDACVKGTITDAQTVSRNTSATEYYVQNSGSTGLFKVDPNGNLFFAQSLCGSCLANGEDCSVNGDCCSNACYYDGDGDRYAPSSGGQKTCKASSQLSGTDCCDSDSRVHPNQNTYYSTESNCGGYDFNCDSSEVPDNSWGECTSITSISLSNSMSSGCGTGYTRATAYGSTSSCGQTVTYYSGIAFYWGDTCDCWSGRYVIFNPGTYDANAYVQGLGGFCNTLLQYSATCECR